MTGCSQTIAVVPERHGDNGAGRASAPNDHSLDGLMDKLAVNRFVQTSLAEWRAILTFAPLARWGAFAASWNRLDRDLWMGDGGIYRRRRFVAFSICGTTIVRKPHQPHYQSRLHNWLNGGLPRRFSPVEREISDHPMTFALLSAGHHFTRCLTNLRGVDWHVEMHQFRIEAAGGEAAWPTPEGLHRDGVLAVLMMLIRRQNVAGGVTSILDRVTSILDAKGRPTAEIELSRPFDAIFLDDRRLRRVVSPITALIPNRPAWRDALVLTFRLDPGSHSYTLKEINHGQ